MTATSAIPSVAASSSTAPDRNAIRSVAIVVRRYSSLTARICAACASPRLKARSVGRPRTTSRKCPARSVRACHRSRARRSVYRPTSHMNTGTSGSVSSISPAETRSIVATKTSTATGTTTASSGLREIPRERRLERIGAGDGGRRDLGALGAVERRGLIWQPPLDELEPQVCEHVRRRPPADDLEAPGGQRAAGRGRDEQDEGRREVVERLTVERSRRHGRDQGGLHEHEQRRDEGERHVGGQQRPHGARAADEARVDHAHRAARSFSGTRSTGVATSSPDRRARKTWYVQPW